MSESSETVGGAPGLPCVHCGLCLDTCPTYRVLGTEADSPRGRIYLMEGVREGSIDLDRDTAGHLDSCLGCLACETACPSGVSYGRRIEEFRPILRRARVLSFRERIWRRIVEITARDPRFTRAAMRAATILDSARLGSLRRRIPGLDVLPVGVDAPVAAADPLARARIPPPVHATKRVALLTGCVADVVRPDITRAAVEVLHRNGIEVINAADQSCCGALALHNGDEDRARALALANTKAFVNTEVDFIVTTASGCGLMMRQYGTLVSNPSYNAQAVRISSKVRDISEVLVEIGVEPPQRPSDIGRVAYHDACHLVHGTNVAAAPRRLLELTLGRPVTDLGENHLCCGSAGSYNLEHPAMARTLGDRKAELAADQNVDVVAVGNVGCMLQIKAAMERLGSTAKTKHPVEILADAYFEETA